MSNVDGVTANQRAGTASRVVLIKLPQSETAPRHTVVIEELSAWA